MEMGVGRLVEKTTRVYMPRRTGGRIAPSSCLTTHFLDLAIGYKAKRWKFSITTNNLIGTSEFTNPTFRYCPNSYCKIAESHHKLSAHL